MADQLHPAHPGFAAHFTDAIYDVGRPENDDILPFGTDEGADMLSKWSHHVGELIARPRLATVLGGSAGGNGGVAVDDGVDILIPAGFTVLYYTGTMTKADERLLLRTLRRKLRDHGSDETLETPRDDLIQFGGGL